MLACQKRYFYVFCLILWVVTLLLSFGSWSTLREMSPRGNRLARSESGALP